MGGDPYATRGNPNPEKDDGYAKPKTKPTYPRGNPSDIPIKPESFAEKLMNAPRRLRETAQEIGQAQVSNYEDLRAAPVRKAAIESYNKKMAENEVKYRKGEITKAMYSTRQKQYMAQRDIAAIPIEKRLVGDINNLGTGGSIRGVADTFMRGAVGTLTATEKRAGEAPVSIMEKVGSTYRASPQPRFKPGKGTKATSPTKGTVVSTVKKGIDFGRSGFGSGLGAGAALGQSAFSFNTPLFGGVAKQEPKTRRKNRR